MTDIELRIRIAQSLAEVPAAAWDACAGAGRLASTVKPTHEDNSPPELSTRGQVDNPFITHDFLSSLETSHSVGGRTGWQPRHLLAEGADGTLLGAAPCYVKSHSRGEYVFDHGWAEAFEHAGGDYYPKLQVAVPFTPVTGPRLLARPGPLAQAVRGGLADALVEITTASELSSAHVTFLTEPEWRALGERGFLQRTDQQFHWENAGYASFDDFLGAPRLAQAQGHPPRAQGGARARHRGGLAHRLRPHRSGVGRLFRLLHGHRLAQMGPALSHPRILFDRRGKNARPHPAGDGQARRALDRRRAQFLRPRHRSSAATGAPSSTIRSCISNCATIRPSTTPFRTNSRASRPARRASTSWRAAICRKPPIPRISSPIRRLRRAIADYLARERAYVRAAGEELAAAAPFRKDLVEQE